MKVEKDTFLESFFNMVSENELNKKILQGKSRDIKDAMWDYIVDIINLEIGDIVTFIKEKCHMQAIVAADVFQFSNFEDATVNLCNAIKIDGNVGLRCREIGLLLLNDGLERNDVALNKYGENHIKTAEALGLAFKDNNKNYYLSCIGLVFNELDIEIRKRLLNRLILRNKLITQVFIATMKKTVDLETFLYDLSKSTYIRRRTNIKRVIGELQTCEEYDFSEFTTKIIY